MTSIEPSARGTPRIVDVVLGAVRPGGRPWPLLVAVGVALVGHLVPLASLLRSRGSLETWAAAVAARIHEEIGRETLVEAPPPPPPVPQPRPEPAKPAPQYSPTAPREAKPVSPAEAGRVIAQSPDASAPRDLTAETFVSGTATTYAGGYTSSAGTSRSAVESLPAAPVDLSRPVRLVDDDWRCPWPATAESADIDQTVVVVQVQVLADGSPGSAHVVRDPGMSFGEAAVGCALRERYEPARDRTGTAVAALSPPIRVRFTR